MASTAQDTLGFFIKLGDGKWELTFIGYKKHAQLVDM